MDYAAFADLFEKAKAAGYVAVLAAESNNQIVPMVVGSPPIDNPFSNKIDPSQPTYFVADGPCGFAWVNFDGRDPFCRYMKKKDLVRPDYPKGFSYWISEYGQSMQKKEIYANAFARSLQLAGVKCSPRSRMD